MDQDAFRRTYREINERNCLYEKSILSRRCGCTQSRKLCIAEREGVQCEAEAGRQQCQEFLELLRQHARFALKTNDLQAVLPHGKAMRLQIGGLRGLHLLLHPGRELPETFEDIFALISQAREEFGGLDQLPYEPLIQQVTAYQGRRRSRGRR